jgi:hypothetical protein
MSRGEAYYAAVPVFIPHVKRVEPAFIVTHEAGRTISARNPRVGLCGVCGLEAVNCRAPGPPQSMDGLGMGVIARSLGLVP